MYVQAFTEPQTDKTSNCVCKGHRNEIKAPNPVVKDLNYNKLSNIASTIKTKVDFMIKEMYRIQSFEWHSLSSSRYYSKWL